MTSREDRLVLRPVLNMTSRFPVYSCDTGTETTQKTTSDRGSHKKNRRKVPYTPDTARNTRNK